MAISAGRALARVALLLALAMSLLMKCECDDDVPWEQVNYTPDTSDSREN